jgi:uncharacterized circularly permuted ATP-grasp superfamily protein
MHTIKPPPASHYDEMLAWTGAGPAGVQVQRQLQSSGGQVQTQTGTVGPRDHYAPYSDWLTRTAEQSLTQRRAQADLLFRRIGITFTVSGDDSGTERLIPSDVIPGARTHTARHRDQPFFG